MRTLSKSKLMAWRQCPKRLWLEIHHPEWRADSAATQASFAVGYEVGDVAQKLYDPAGQGALIDPGTEGFDAAFARTQQLLQADQPIFEAGFRAAGGMAFADVLLPVQQDGQRAWRMVEVKSSTSVKDYHRDDAAVQAYIAREAGVPLASIALAHIDSAWVYPGHQDYHGLLVEADLTADAFSRGAEVQDWISAAQQIASQASAPAISTGPQCGHPYACGFFEHCQSQEPQATYPLDYLPGRRSQDLQAHIAAHHLIELRDVPDHLLNPRQQRVKAVTLSGQVFFDQAGAAQALAPHPLPAWFIDFETIQFAVPIWPGTRPYQQIPFQFSVHHLSDRGQVEQHAYLNLSGEDPRQGFAEALIQACGKQGPVFVYNAAFEKTRIRELAEQFPALAAALLAINHRVVDLLPIARDHYYHHSQHGSWSIKCVLPAACPELSYQQLDGVQDGGMAMDAFLEALAADTSSERRAELERQLLAYCALDTYAMIRLWSVFSGQTLGI